MTTNGSMIFRGGMPYGPDVSKLKDIFPVASLTEGRTIIHEELEAAIGYKKGSPRFYGVINAWMNNQRNEFGIFMIWEPAKGVSVLNPAEVFSHGKKRTREKSSQFGRATKIFRWVDRTRLDEIGQKHLDHSILVAVRMKQALDSGTKELASDLSPVKSLPKPLMVKTG